MHVMGSVSPANEGEAFSLQQEDAAEPRLAARSCDTEGNLAPPPPPPPPLLPPPPPPPPLLPGLGDPTGGLRKKKRVRSFFWKTIPEEQVRGRSNLWTQRGQQQQRYQIDVHTIEELFGQNDCQSDGKATPTRGGRTRTSFRDTADQVSILDAKRGMNIGIFLKQFKRSNQMIIDDIRHGNSEPYGAEPLRELLKLLPETEEVKKMRAYRGDVSKLSLADSFVFLLVQLPSHSLRIESMLLKEEFPAACESMKTDIRILRCATKEVMRCEELHAVLHLVLQAGNILNAGGYAGNAVGFKLSSLLSLADTKANKPGMNLLHFVALEAQKKDQKLLDFPEKLLHVQAASRISLETLDSELDWLTSRTHSMEENVQSDTELLQQLGAFLQSAKAAMSSLRSSRLQLKREGSELIDFFCEDRDTFKLDDCFSIFHSFCGRFSHAVKENKEREAKEAARRRRLQELEDQKRHSWAGGEEVGGAFGLRSSSETDMSRHGEAGLLMELLSPKSRSPSHNPHSPLGRSASLRRSRNSPSSSPSLAADRKLNIFLGIPTEAGKVASHGGASDSPTASPEPGDSPRTSPVHLRVPQSSENTHLTTTSYLSHNATETTTPTHTLESTSDPDWQSDPNNNGRERRGSGSGCQVTSSDKPTPQNAQPDPKAAGAANNNNNSDMSVFVEKHTLVPELRAFEEVSDHAKPLHGNQDDVIAAEKQEEEVDGPKVQDAQGKEQPEEEEEQEEKVVVWCVTGVCEAAGDVTRTENSDDQFTPSSKGGNQSDSCSPASCAPSEPHPANEKQVPVPISSQPVPVSRCDDSPLSAASTRWRPADPILTGQAASGEATGQEGKPEEPTHEPREPDSAEGTASCHATGEEEASSTGGETQAAPKPPSKTSTTSQSKPAAAGVKGKPIRTLNNSENQGMRRVVPISRSQRGTPAPDRIPEKPPTQRGSTPSRGERPWSAPLSQRSSSHKAPERKDLQRKPSIRKPLSKPEEKMCRSTLRALSHAAEGGGAGSSLSAPVTPSHKAASSPSCPSFARNTASSSFRRTHSTLAPPRAPQTTPESPKPSPAFTRTASLRIAATSRSSEQLPPSSPLRRTNSIRAPLRPSLHEGVAPPKGHKRNDSGSFSDKSVQSRDSVRVSRPSWR